MSGLSKVKMSAFMVKIGAKNAKRGHHTFTQGPFLLSDVSCFTFQVFYFFFS